MFLSLIPSAPLVAHLQSLSFLVFILSSRGFQISLNIRAFCGYMLKGIAIRTSGECPYLTLCETFVKLFENFIILSRWNDRLDEALMQRGVGRLTLCHSILNISSSACSQIPNKKACIFVVLLWFGRLIFCDEMFDLHYRTLCGNIFADKVHTSFAIGKAFCTSVSSGRESFRVELSFF